MWRVRLTSIECCRRGGSTATCRFDFRAPCASRSHSQHGAQCNLDCPAALHSKACPRCCLIRISPYYGTFSQITSNYVFRRQYGRILARNHRPQQRCNDNDEQNGVNDGDNSEVESKDRAISRSQALITRIKTWRPMRRMSAEGA